MSRGSVGLRPQIVAGLFVGAAVVQWGAISVLGKVAANRAVPVPPLLSIRFAVAAGILGVVLALQGKSLKPAPGEGLRLAALGAFGYGVSSTLFFISLRHGTVSALMLLYFTYPVWVSAISAVSGAGMPSAKLIGSLVAALLGAVVMITSLDRLTITGLGATLALVSSLAIALYFIGGEIVLRKTSSLVAAMAVSAGASVALATFALASGRQGFAPAMDQWPLILALASCTACSFVCLFAGLRRLGAIRTSIVATLEPVAAAALAVVFLGESIRFGTIVGGLLILSGAVVASLIRMKALEPGPFPEAPIP